MMTKQSKAILVATPVRSSASEQNSGRARRISDDPLFYPEFWGRPSARLEREILEERWFPDRPSQGDLALPPLGRLVWLDDRGGAVERISPARLRATQGNIFSDDKLATFAAMIRDRKITHAYIPTVYSVGMVDLADVMESQRLRKEDLSYDGLTRPYTTDDPDLDAYLADPDEYVRLNVMDDDNPDEVSDLITDMKDRARRAEAEGWGDVGTRVGQLYAGNHRAFAALLSGEPEIWVRVMEQPTQPTQPTKAKARLKR